MALIPATHRPAPRAEPVDDPVVAREIARAQRIVEGQNFDIRRTLWKLLGGRRRAAAHRLRLAPRRAARRGRPGVCAGAGGCRPTPRSSTRSGRTRFADAERRITLHVLDNAWAEHLAFIDDSPRRHPPAALRRTRADHRVPPPDRSCVRADDRARAGSDSGDLRTGCEVRDGAIDLAAAGLAGSTSTWTYLVDDNPFSTLGAVADGEPQPRRRRRRRLPRDPVRAADDHRGGDVVPAEVGAAAVGTCRRGLRS